METRQQQDDRHTSEHAELLALHAKEHKEMRERHNAEHLKLQKRASEALDEFKTIAEAL